MLSSETRALDPGMHSFDAKVTAVRVHQNSTISVVAIEALLDGLDKFRHEVNHDRRVALSNRKLPPWKRLPVASRKLDDVHALGQQWTSDAATARRARTLGSSGGSTSPATVITARIRCSRSTARHWAAS